MGYRDENPQHRRGIEKPKYRCPNCNKGLKITKPVTMLICGHCRKTITKEQLK